MTTADRQPKGIPTGGQFAPSTHGEPSVNLTTLSKAAPATDEDLGAFIESNGTAARQALQDVELASAGLAARKILAAHPTAAFAEIQTDSWDNGEFVSGAAVKDARNNTLKMYVEYDGTGASQEVVGLLKNLDAEASNAHWSGAFSTGSYGKDLYAIDLSQAAAWTPAGDQ